MPTYRNKKTGRTVTKDKPSPVLEKSPRYETVDDAKKSTKKENG